MSFHHGFKRLAYTILDHDFVINLVIVKVRIKVELLLNFAGFFVFIKGFGIQDSGIPGNIGHHDDLGKFLKIGASGFSKHHVT